VSQTKRQVASWVASASEDVRPCPFCGAAPRFHPLDPDRDGDAWGTVRCENKSCATFDDVRGYGVSVRDGETINDERGTTAYMKAAMARWDTRR
jgi:hypothetical protein